MFRHGSIFAGDLTLLVNETGPRFSPEFQNQLQNLLLWRRDVRRFRADPLPEGLLEQLLQLCRLAPSVGLSEPWRFLNVSTPAIRDQVCLEFERANAEALAGYSGERATLYASLKLAGLREAPVHLAVFSDPASTQGHGLGRASMPEMLEYSVVNAIGVLWLAARAQGVGLGWVSILCPQRVSRILSAPPAWRLVAYLCLGFPLAEDTVPELERAGWEARRQGPLPLETR